MSIPAYTDHTEARTLALGLPGLAALLALPDDVLDSRLTLASVDIDAANRYQGRKYDQTQLLEFPRLDAAPSARQYPPAPPSINDPSFFVFGGAPSFIWDWDPEANGGAGAAVVPAKVKLACIYQAASYDNTEIADRLENIRSGLAAQTTGSASETFLKPADLAIIGGLSGLCNRARMLLDKYRLRSGRIL